MQKTTDSIIVFLIITSCIILTLAAFILTILYLYRKRQITYHKEIETIKSDYEKNSLKIQLEMQEQIFQSISRDIHDNINLSLTLAKLNLNTLDLTNGEHSAQQVNTSIDFVSRAITDLSDISRSMNSEIIAEQGLIIALEQEIIKLKKLNWFEIEFKVTGNPVFIYGQKEVFIFRIIQEAFNNIVKHAQAKEVLLHLHYDSALLIMNIRDNGIGFLTAVPDIEKKKIPPTAGLRNMQSRAEFLNGTFDLKSSPSKGTKIKITIPLV